MTVVTVLSLFFNDELIPQLYTKDPRLQRNIELYLKKNKMIMYSFLR
jgi:hypothetical protein